MRSKVIAKTVLLNERGQALLLRRSKTDTRRPGGWDFPGGMVEHEENITAGARREILEETGLAVPEAGLKLVYAATEAYEDVSVVRLLFTARVSQAMVRLSFEHDSFRWVEIATALQDFPHPFYGTGLAYAAAHDLL